MVSLYFLRRVQQVRKYHFNADLRESTLVGLLLMVNIWMETTQWC